MHARGWVQLATNSVIVNRMGIGRRMSSSDFLRNNDVGFGGPGGQPRGVYPLPIQLRNPGTNPWSKGPLERLRRRFQGPGKDANAVEAISIYGSQLPSVCRRLSTRSIWSVSSLRVRTFLRSTCGCGRVFSTVRFTIAASAAPTATPISSGNSLSLPSPRCGRPPKFVASHRVLP